MGRFDGKVALITGSARGIGYATARLFAGEGALVGICDLKDEDSKKAAKALGEVGKEGVGFAMDVSDSASVEAGISSFVKSQGGKLDILVNNAGVTKDGLLMRMTDEQWDLVLKINLYSMFYCIRAAVKPMMKNRYGRIINLSSVSGIMGNPGQANYAASKGGVISLTKTVAKEFASRNITCNAIAPGFIKTALTDLMTEKAHEAMLGMIPLGRFGVPEDIMGTIAFLASDEASYITGQVIQIDGGLAM